MTTIAILGGDWEIAFDDETVGTNAVAGLRMVRQISGTTVYATRTVYSAVADVTDDFTAMGFKNPMLPVTPNAYTMENKYFMPRSSMEFLKEGAIEADWTVTTGDGVYRKTYTVVTDFVSGDIGRQVTETTSGDTGTLLDFEVTPDGTNVCWIRPDTSGDTFALSTTISVTGDGGTGSNTGAAAATSGVTKVPAIQAIGSVPTATEVYLYQDRIKMTDSTGAFQWWATDTTVSLGIISILVRIQDAGVLIADGDVEVFARRYTSLYDNFRLNVAGGGFSALPLASAPDINNTTGYRSTACTGGAGTFNSGNGIYTGASWATATKRGVLTADASGTTPTLEYYLVGDLTDFANPNAIQEYVFSTSLDGDASAFSGIPGANAGGPTEAGAGNGATVAITIGHFDVDHTGDATTEPYSVQVDTQSDVPIATVYEVLKYRTRRGADEADLFGAGTNVPGESYRGIEAIFEYDASTGTLGSGEDLLTTTGGSTWTSRLVGQSASTSPSYITVTDQQTSLDAVVDNDVIEDEAGTEDVTVHAGGTVGIESITSPKASPLGTFTGTQIFGARGVVFINPAAADTQAYILTDDFGVLNNPPNTVSYLVTNTAAGYRILVARDTGTAGVIDKDQFGGLAAPLAAYNGLSDLIIRVAGSVDLEVPQSGYVRIVDTGLQQEHNYVYDSRTTGALGEFSLRVVDVGSAITTAGTTETKLFDTTAGFNTAPIALPGMLIRNTTNGDDVYEITNVVSDTELDIVKLYGAGTWTVTDTYTLNALIGDHTVPADYSTADDVFDLILDVEATGTSVTNTFTKTLAADFGTVVNVRAGKVILPFTQNQTQGDGNTTVTVVATPDTIAV